MAIPDHKIEELRDVADIVDVVNDHVRLKRSGSRYKGLCPFHDEKTPSFSVDPDKNLYYCFGCQRGGDVFKFVQEIEGVGFLESVRMLADHFGVPLPEDEVNPDAANDREAIFHALRWAARWYYNQLTDSNGGYRALEYLHDRGFLDRTIARFGLGWAPDRWDGLLSAAEDEQIDEEILHRAGLIIERKDGSGYYDRYRGRVIFPILSHVGKVLGFAGRILDADANQPKYINSPETEVYRKKKVLFGLSQAKTSIREKDTVAVVEGYTDVISMHQNGIPNVVASCGTALTEDHLSIISRYCGQVQFLFDSDSSGVDAALKGADTALAHGFEVGIALLPSGEDPDTFIQSSGVESFKSYIEDNISEILEFRVEKAKREGDMDNPVRKRKAIQDLLESLANIEDPILRDDFVKDAAEQLDVYDAKLRRALDDVIDERESRRRREERRKERRQAQNSVSTGRRNDDRFGSSTDERSEQPPAHRDEDRGGESSLSSENANVAGNGGGQNPPIPEEKVLLRLMLEHGTPMVEFILGNMSLGEFTEGPARDMVEVFIDMYGNDAVKPSRITDGEFGDELQNLAASVMVDKYTPSENWRQRQNITVPRFNQEPYEAGASAMTLLKLDRVDDAITRQKEKMFEASRSGGDENVGELQKEMMQLYEMRKRIKRREFLDWE